MTLNCSRLKERQSVMVERGWRRGATSLGALRRLHATQVLGSKLIELIFICLLLFISELPRPPLSLTHFHLCQKLHARRNYWLIILLCLFYLLLELHCAAKKLKEEKKMFRKYNNKYICSCFCTIQIYLINSLLFFCLLPYCLTYAAQCSFISYQFYAFFPHFIYIFLLLLPV